MTSKFWKHRLYSRDPVAELMALGGNILVNIDASPFHLGESVLRREMLARASHSPQRARHLGQSGRRQRSTGF